MNTNVKHWMAAWSAMEHEKRVEAFMVGAVVSFGILMVVAVCYVALTGGK